MPKDGGLSLGLIFAVMLVLAAAFLVPLSNADTTLPAQATIQSQVVITAINYLAANYNHTIGLIHESPDSENFSNTYWLSSDNYISQQALQSVSVDNASIAVMANNISQTMTQYLRGQPNPYNQYMVLTTGLFPFDSAKAYTFGHVGGAVIKSTVNNQTGTLSPMSYADVAFLQAIAYYRNGESQNALTVYRDGLMTWDGFGFKDAAYNGTYATYKLALYVLASKILGQTINDSIISELLNLQLHTGADNGGFATSYTGNGKPASGTNTETTSLAILAFEANRYIPVGAFLYEWYGFNETSGKWTGGLGTSHWNDSAHGIVKDVPAIGFYASDSNATLAWQLSNMQKAGISVIVVSWWGVGNESGSRDNALEDAAIDSATLNVFRYVESTKNLWNFKIAIMVEPFNQTDLTTAEYASLYSYIQNTFYHPFNDITFYWQGAPLLLSFNPQRLPSLPTLSVFTYEEEGEPPNLPPVNWVFWQGDNYLDSSGGTAVPKNYENAPYISPDGEVGVLWRYDDYYLSTYGGDVGGRTAYMRFDVSGSQGMYDYEWSYIIDLRSSVNLVLLYSWNEYHERTALEPHTDFTVGPFNGVGITSYYAQALEEPTTAIITATCPNCPGVLWVLYFVGVVTVLGSILALVVLSRRRARARVRSVRDV